MHRGPYGDRQNRGNCSGCLIKDLLRYFEVTRVLDPMTGSGTRKDVSREPVQQRQRVDGTPLALL
jgi:hypothetical protein